MTVQTIQQTAKWIKFIGLMGRLGLVVMVFQMFSGNAYEAGELFFFSICAIVFAAIAKYWFHS